MKTAIQKTEDDFSQKNVTQQRKINAHLSGRNKSMKKTTSILKKKLSSTDKLAEMYTNYPCFFVELS